MATFSLNTSLAVSSSVATTLGSYAVPANSYFVGQASVSVSGGAGYAEVTVGGVVAGVLAKSGTPITGSTPVEVRTVQIYAGPGQTVSTSSVTLGGTIYLSGVLFINTP